MAESLPTVDIVDDDATVRKSLQRLLLANGFLTRVYADADSYLLTSPHQGIGCMILDLKMPGLDGLELQQRMVERGDDLPIIFLTGHGDIPQSVNAIKAGATDFLVKPVEEAQLLQAVHAALQAHASSIDYSRQRRDISDRVEKLTPRERDILRNVISGALNKQIADGLGISEKTVKIHRGNMMRKMAVGSVAELVYACAIAGIEPPVS